MDHMNNGETVFEFFGNAYSIPKYEIYTTDILNFKIRYFLWMLSHNNKICNQFFRSFQNVTVSNLK